MNLTENSNSFDFSLSRYEKKIRQKNVDSEPRLKLYGRFPQTASICIFNALSFSPQLRLLNKRFSRVLCGTFFISDVDVTRSLNETALQRDRDHPWLLNKCKHRKKEGGKGQGGGGKEEGSIPSNLKHRNLNITEKAAS